MKRLSIILVLLSVLSLLSCKKIEAPEEAKMVLSNVNVEFFSTSTNNMKDAVITADYTYPGPLKEFKLLLSNYSNMNYYNSYSVNDSGTLITSNVGSLRVGYTYYFCVQYDDGIGFNYSDTFSFTVE